MKEFRIAKCLNKSGEIAEYAIFADGSRRRPIQTDEIYGQYFEVDNELNKETQTLRRLSYDGRIKDAVDMIKNGNGDCIKSTHIFGSKIIKVVYFVDRKVGEELRKKTLDGWKDTEFGYGIEYGFKGGFGGYSLINTQLESISAFSKNRKPMVFDSEDNAEAYVLSILEKAKAYAKDMDKKLQNASKDAADEIIDNIIAEIEKETNTKFSILADFVYDMVDGDGRLKSSEGNLDQIGYEIVQCIKD